jgi:hypothetical protein
LHIDARIVDDDDFAVKMFQTTLPARTDYVAPDETSANRTIVFDRRVPQGGKLVRAFSWSFDDG